LAFRECRWLVRTRCLLWAEGIPSIRRTWVPEGLGAGRGFGVASEEVANSQRALRETHMKSAARAAMTCAALVVAATTASPAFADDCTKVLIQNTLAVQNSSAARYAMSHLADTQLTESEKSGLGITVPIEGVPVSLSGSQDKAYTSKFFEQTGVNWSRETSVNILRQTLSEHAAQLYKTCIEGNRKSGPFIIAYDATPTAVSVSLTWVAPVGAPTKTKAVEVKYEGADKADTDAQLAKWGNKEWKTGESRVLQVKRVAKTDIRMDVVVAGELDHLYIPYSPTVTVTKHRVPKRWPLATDPHPEFVLETDEAGHNEGPKKDCLDTGDENIEAGSSFPVETLRGGPLDSTTWVHASNDQHRVCVEGYLRPLFSHQGGVLTYHVQYVVDAIEFTVQ
jgi:hypothetical protein